MLSCTRKMGIKMWCLWTEYWKKLENSPGLGWRNSCWKGSPGIKQHRREEGNTKLLLIFLLEDTASQSTVESNRIGCIESSDTCNCCFHLYTRERAEGSSTHGFSVESENISARGCSVSRHKQSPDCREQLSYPI